MCGWLYISLETSFNASYWLTEKKEGKCSNRKHQNFFKWHLMVPHASVEPSPKQDFDLPKTPITRNLMGRDCSTPNTLFFLPPNFGKTHKNKRVYGVPCIWCEIKKIGQHQIHVEFTFTRISAYILGSLSDKNNIFNLICIQITGQNAGPLLLRKMPYFWAVAGGWCEHHLLDFWWSLLVRALWILMVTVTPSERMEGRSLFFL